jgi:hypothetical protein
MVTEIFQQPVSCNPSAMKAESRLVSATRVVERRKGQKGGLSFGKTDKSYSPAAGYQGISSTIAACYAGVSYEDGERRAD